MNHISAVMLTKNSARYLYDALYALRELDEVVVVDNGSSDGTLEIARSFSFVRIVQEPFIGFGPLKQRGSAYAKNDWILSVDSDEVASPEAIKELLEMELDAEMVYALRFYNYYRGKKIRCCGWYPDLKLRLYHRGVADFDDALVHENLRRKDGGALKKGALTEHFHHYSYADASGFLEKMQRYTTLFAKQHQGKKEASIYKAFAHSLFAFFKAWILQKGCLEGRAGFLVAAYNAQSVFWKYVKLLEANEEHR